MSSKPSIYVGGPISGTNKEECIKRFKKLAQSLQRGFVVNSPLEAITTPRTEMKFRGEYDGAPELSNHAIVERDKWSIEHSDFMLMNFSGAEKTSLGCAVELGWAMYNSVHVVVVMDEDSEIYNHAFIKEAAHVVFFNMEDALNYLYSFV